MRANGVDKIPEYSNELKLQAELVWLERYRQAMVEQQAQLQPLIRPKYEAWIAQRAEWEEA